MNRYTSKPHITLQNHALDNATSPIKKSKADASGWA